MAGSGLKIKTHLVHRRVRQTLAQQFFHVSYAKVAYTDALQLALLLGLYDGFPTLSTHLWSPEGAVNEIQVNVAQTTLFEGLVDRSDCVGFTVIRFQLGGVEDVRSLETVVVDELADGTPTALFIVVPIRRVLREAFTF